ncbi:MAG: PASTA domain-containing protein [Lachnospiraceae bacterium]|nr:PASTA domain-containing protein [Lachnospiraceae bacterium]
MLKIGSIFAGRYKVLEHIGQGGMADVYKAEDMSLNREVALKVLKGDYSDDPAFIKRFKAEGQAAASLNNDNVVAVYNVGNSGRDYYIVMEFVDGITLKEYIRRKGMLSPRETMAITAQVAVGLRAAHQKHIIHRDIKPQNIILSRDGKVKVADFGIARANTDETRTMNTQAIGSVHYISPEQAKGGDCDERSDIYSLGISMYEMVTGQVPFDKPTSIAVALAHMNETMIPPSALNPECPVSLEQIIFRCTQKSRDRRYHNCTELLLDLKIAVATPDYDFEKQERESLMRSDTMVFTGQVMDELQQDGRKNTAIVDENFEEKTAENAVAQDPTGGVVPSRRKGESQEEDRDAEDDGEDTAPQERRKHRNLFNEDKKEDEKSLLDRVLLIIGIVLGTAMILMLIYIFSSLSGCNQRSGKKPTASPPVTQTNVPEESSTFFIDDTTDMETEEEITVETFESDYFDPDTMTVVPQVVGSMFDSAIKILRDRGLNYHISSNVVYSDVYKSGTVVKQSYSEGTIVPKDSVILITLSYGSDKFEITDQYIGEDVSDFRYTMSQYKDIINVEYIKENSDTVPVNRIISLDPSSGTIGQGDTLKVIYSGGPAMVTVPGLVGKTQAEAVSLLNRNGLELGDVSKDYNADVEEGFIIYQQYPEGQSVANGSRVNIVVSLGPRSQTVPDLKGKTQAEAEKLLKELNFLVAVVEERAPSDKEIGKVLRQDIEAGTLIREGETITITVGIDKIRKTVPNATTDSDGDPYDVESAVLVMHEAGFMKVDTTTDTVETDVADLVGLVADQYPKAGEEYSTEDTVRIALYVLKKEPTESEESSSDDEDDDTTEKDASDEDTEPAESSSETPASSETPESSSDKETSSETSSETEPSSEGEEEPASE